MERRIKIKVCGMRDADNLQELVDLHPDYIGLIFYASSKRYVKSINSRKAILEIPSSIHKVGVFVNTDFDEIMEEVKTYELQCVQLHGSESPELCKRLHNEGLVVIKVFSVGSTFGFGEVKPYEDSCNYYLFDTKGEHHGGHGVTFDWSLLGGYDNKKPIFLSGGLDQNNIKEVLDLGLNIHAVDLNSKFELEPGLKNIELLKTSVFDTFK